VVLGEFGELDASGSMSLLADESDSLRFELRADSLGALNPWLNPTLEALAAPTLAATSASSATAPVSRVEGTAWVRGWLTGEPGRMSIRGRAEGSRLSYRDLVADSFDIQSLDVGRTDGRVHARGDLTAANVLLGKLAFDRLALSADYGDSLSTAGFAFSKGDASVSGHVNSSIVGDMRTFGIDTLTVQLASSTWTLQQPVTMQLAGSGAKALGVLDVVSAAGRITAAGTIEASGPTAFQANVEGADLAEMSVLWSDSVDIAGVVEARAELSGSAEDPVLQGDFEIADGRLYGVDFSTLRGSFDYQGGNAEIDVSAWQGDSRMFRLHGTTPFDVTLPGPGFALPERTFALTLEGDSIPLTLASIITDQIAEPQGRAQGTVFIRGTPHHIDLQGPIAISNGSFRVLRTGILYTDIKGALSFEGNTMDVWGAELRGSGGGSGVVRGTVTFGTLTNPEFDLTLEAVTLPGYDQLDAFAILSGSVTLRGLYEAPIVTGDLSIISGVLFVEEVGRQREIVDIFAEGFTLLGEMDESDRPSISPFLQNLTMDLNLDVAQDTWLRSADMNVEIAGDLIVEMRPGQEEWVFRGTLQAVRGDYRLFNKRFAVDGGTVEFPGTPGIDPSLRILALYTVQTQKQPIEIQLQVGGTLANPTLDLDSDHQPRISQSDLLSYLLFGRPSYELTRTSQERNLIDDVTAGVPQAFVGYALSSLLVGEAGIAYVDVSRVTPSGAEGEYRAGVGPALTATQVEVGWYLAPTVFVSVAQHLVGAVRPTVRLDWRLDDNLTLRGITEPRFGREGVLYYGGPGQSLEQSIGVFLFYGWSY
jgi:translocation and assembly module TamB